MITFTISIHGVENLEQLAGVQAQVGQPQVQMSVAPATPEPQLPKFPPPSIPETPEAPENLMLDPQPMVHHIYCETNKPMNDDNTPPPLPSTKPPQEMLKD